MPTNLHQVVFKIKVLITESTGCLLASTPLPSAFSTWLGISTLGLRKSACFKLVSAFPWRFRGTVDEFKTLWMSSSSAVIFFDGASKGNSGTTRARGLIISLDRKSEFSFSWGLGTMSNNQAESYSLLMASQIAKTKGFKSQFKSSTTLRC